MYFRPEEYDQVVHQWRRRPFLREQFNCFFGEPVGFEYKLKQARRKILIAKAKDEEELTLVDMVSSKQASVMFSLSSDRKLKRKEDTVHLDGFFVSKVFIIRHLRKDTLSHWVEDMDEWVEEAFGQCIGSDNLFLHYPQKPSMDGKTTYAVLFVQVKGCCFL